MPSAGRSEAHQSLALQQGLHPLAQPGDAESIAQGRRPIVLGGQRLIDHPPALGGPHAQHQVELVLTGQIGPLPTQINLVDITTNEFGINLAVKASF